MRSLDELSGPEYFAFAYRLTAYSGVMAARLAQAQQDGAPSGRQEVPATRGAIGVSEIADLVEWGA